MWYQQQPVDYCDDDSLACNSTSPANGGQDDDDGTVVSTSLDSFVLRRLKSSALEKWGQSNSSLCSCSPTTSTAPTMNVIFDSASSSKVGSDLEDSDDEDEDSIGTCPSQKKKTPPALKQVIPTSTGLLERPLPLSTKSKSTGIKPLSKTSLRRVKSDCSSSPQSRKKKKTLMRKVVSDADKARYVPNSKILEDNSDRWADDSMPLSSRSYHDSKRNRVAGLLQKNNAVVTGGSSRSLSPRFRSPSTTTTTTNNKTEDGQQQRRKLVRAVSDLGNNSKRADRSSSSTSINISKKKTEKRRMIQESVSNLAARASTASSSSPITTTKKKSPSISEIRTMMEQCHLNHNHDSDKTKNKTTTKNKKKSISRCLSENNAPDLHSTSKSCHSRIIVPLGDGDELTTVTKKKKTRSSSSQRLGRSLSPPPTALRRGRSHRNTTTTTPAQIKSSLLGSSKSCHNRMISSSSSSSSSHSSTRRRSRSSSPKKTIQRNKSSTSSSSLPPPDFRWDLFKPDALSPPQPQAMAA